MKTRIFFIVIGAIIIIGVGLAIFTSKKSSQSPDQNTVFAQCLKDQGVKFYGAFWCPHCQAQKRLFGKKASEALNYIECSTADGKAQNETCKAANIESYPTWEFADGSRQKGEMTFAELADRTSCINPLAEQVTETETEE